MSRLSFRSGSVGPRILPNRRRSLPPSMVVFGGGSIQLARVFGIRIGVDVSWFLVLFIIIYVLTGYYQDVGAGSGAFLLATISALLFFLLIAAVCFGLGALISSPDDALEGAVYDSSVSSQATAVLGYLMSINVIVLFFNLIPGFPLDGGRIARAITGKITGDRNRATRFAAILGRGVGWVLVAAGLVYGLQIDLFGGLWLALIGWFLTQAASSAQAQAAFAGRIEHLRVGDVMDAEPIAIPRDLTLDRAERPTR